MIQRRLGKTLIRITSDGTEIAPSWERFMVRKQDSISTHFPFHYFAFTFSQLFPGTLLEECTYTQLRDHQQQRHTPIQKHFPFRHKQPRNVYSVILKEQKPLQFVVVELCSPMCSPLLRY